MLSAIFKKEQAAEAAPESASTGLWQLAMRRLKRDRIAMFSLIRGAVLSAAVGTVNEWPDCQRLE